MMLDIDRALAARYALSFDIQLHRASSTSLSGG